MSRPTRKSLTGQKLYLVTKVKEQSKELAAWHELGEYIETCGLLGVFEIQRIRREVKKLLHPKRKKK